MHTHIHKKKVRAQEALIKSGRYSVLTLTFLSLLIVSWNMMSKPNVRSPGKDKGDGEMVKLRISTA